MVGACVVVSVYTQVHLYEYGPRGRLLRRVRDVHHRVHGAQGVRRVPRLRGEQQQQQRVRHVGPNQCQCNTYDSQR